MSNYIIKNWHSRKIDEDTVMLINYSLGVRIQVSTAELKSNSDIMPNNEESELNPDYWSKVPVDTVVSVKNWEVGVPIKRHFADFKNGFIYTFPNGKSSQTINDIDLLGLERWIHGKIAKNIK